jgi:hypothetical protein
MKLDELRRKMTTSGLSSEDAALATGLAAEYAMDAWKEGWSLGYNNASIRQAHREKALPTIPTSEHASRRLT